jgi:hypothetical protein
MRPIATAAGMCLLAFAAQAASPKVESASKVFQSVAGDPAKLKTFCEMNQVIENAEETPDQAAATKIQGYMQQLGQDFEQAWNIGNEVDENSEDGKTFIVAMDNLAKSCG